MKLSISNITWDAENDIKMYGELKKHGFSGIEIAPSRLFSPPIYDNFEVAEKLSKELSEVYNLRICSMQSIWYGKTENIFDGKQQSAILLNYTKKAILFSVRCGCGNLVFGCPKNRNMSDPTQMKTALLFFSELAEFSKKHGTVIALEANPIIYGTNFINTTAEAVAFVRRVNSPGLRVNLDLGTMLYNEESIASVSDYFDFINHIHISEPYLEKIQKRSEHIQLAKILEKCNYQNYISIEMKRQDRIEDVLNIIHYISETFETRRAK